MMKRFSALLIVLGCCFVSLFAAPLKPSMDGRAVVAAYGELPVGLFAKSAAYLPGDTVVVTNPSTHISIEVMIFGSFDSTEGIAIVLSPEAARELYISRGSNVIVQVTKKSDAYTENTILSKTVGSYSAADDPDEEPNQMVDAVDSPLFEKPGLVVEDVVFFVEDPILPPEETETAGESELAENAVDSGTPDESGAIALEPQNASSEETIPDAGPEIAEAPATESAGRENEIPEQVIAEPLVPEGDAEVAAAPEKTEPDDVLVIEPEEVIAEAKPATEPAPEETLAESDENPVGEVAALVPETEPELIAEADETDSPDSLSEIVPQGETENLIPEPQPPLVAEIEPEAPAEDTEAAPEPETPWWADGDVVFVDEMEDGGESVALLPPEDTQPETPETEEPPAPKQPNQAVLDAIADMHRELFPETLEAEAAQPEAVPEELPEIAEVTEPEETDEPEGGELPETEPEIFAEPEAAVAAVPEIEPPVSSEAVAEATDLPEEGLPEAQPFDEPETALASEEQPATEPEVALAPEEGIEPEEEAALVPEPAREEEEIALAPEAQPFDEPETALAPEELPATEPEIALAPDEPEEDVIIETEVVLIPTDYNPPVALEPVAEGSGEAENAADGAPALKESFAAEALAEMESAIAEAEALLEGLFPEPEEEEEIALLLEDEPEVLNVDAEEEEEPLVVVPEPVYPEKTVHVSALTVVGQDELPKDRYAVQIMTVHQPSSAESVKNTFGKNYPLLFARTAKGDIQVLVGPLTQDEYAVVLERFKIYGYKDAFVRYFK